MQSNITFTLITFFGSSLTTLIALILLIILFVHLKQQRDVTVLLVANTYAAMIVFSVLLLSTSVNVLKADLYGLANRTEMELNGCRFQGFLLYETFGCLYMTFVLQAFHRLTRVIYATRRFLQTFSFNFICIILQWILSFLLLLPSYLWPGPLYSLYESDYYCGIEYDKLAGLLYTVMNIYFLPVIYLSIIYARLMYFLRTQPLRLSQTQQRRRAQRDCIVIRRILFTVNILTLPGLPNLVFGIVVNIERNLSGAYFMYRIQWMSATVTMFICSIVLIFITPQMKEIVIKFMRCENRVAPAATTERVIKQPTILIETKF